eukprot:TRINITY_DN16162_c0_g1_i1.p1 TRINITY_DN16162_c0_g1~~TRINITY_DN16162_c0_g1_i1.p1  ORF type:complete len:712 (+),score=287.06 TRINITY_DN16162_c0_g1_i1:71-2206(+)
MSAPAGKSRMAGFFSEAVNSRYYTWDLKKTKSKFVGLGEKMQAQSPAWAKERWTLDPFKNVMPSRKNIQNANGAHITAMWLPENAKKKNMRPRFEVFNTSEAEGLKLRATKRLSQVALPVGGGMKDDVRIHRHSTESLHGLQHAPLLHQQWDPERQEPVPFAKYDAEGRPIPPEPLPDFPRFFNRERFGDLDAWQRSTNETRYNSDAETFVYFHFWAHDDKWIHRRRVDVWDYVKSQTEEYVREKLDSVQRILYGKVMPKDHIAPCDGVVLRRSPERVVATDGAFAKMEVDISCRPIDPTQEGYAGAQVQWAEVEVGKDNKWKTLFLDSNGNCTVRFQVALAQTAVPIEVRVAVPDMPQPMKNSTNPDPVAPKREKEARDARLSFTPQADPKPADLSHLKPPTDLARALPGWSEEEVRELYAQELYRFEEDLLNTLYNIDAIMHPTPVLYACQNELTPHFTAARFAERQSKKDIDWWFHHQSFILYLPFYEEEFMHRLQNWRATVNQKVGNSAWADQIRQYSPQPVNALMQVFRKHNSVWDSRVFKVEHEVEGEFQEEAAQEWSYVEDPAAKEPQPTPPTHLRARHPKPIDDPDETLLDPEAAQTFVWSQLRSPTDKMRVDGAPRDYAEEYWADSFAARREAGVPVHPDDQPSVETDVEAATPAAPEGQRKKYIRRMGKLYRKYVNPYNPNPQRFVSPQYTSQHTVGSQFW